MNEEFVFPVPEENQSSEGMLHDGSFRQVIPTAGIKEGDSMFCKLHVPEDVLAGCLERDAVRDTAPLEHPQLKGNSTGAEHDPVVHVVDAGQS